MAESNETAPTPKKGGNKTLIIVVAAALLVIGGMAVMMFKGNAAKQGGKEAKKEVVGVEMPLGEFTVNLADQDQIRYLKADIVLEVDEKAAEPSKGKGKGEEAAAAPAPIRDAVIEVLSDQTFEELLKADGRKQLKDQIIEAVNPRLKGGKALDVYFNEFAMQ